MDNAGSLHLQAAAAAPALRMLLLDTCGETAGVGLCEKGALVAERTLAGRVASAGILVAVRELLASQSLALADLDAIGVVAGPGSFTGVRTGLAAAKGMCEAAELRLAAMSRLAVLAQASRLDDGLALLSAGREDVYVRDQRGEPATEFMSTVEDLRELSVGRRIVTADAVMKEWLAPLPVELHVLTLADAVVPLVEALARGGSDLAAADANYVRSESELYRTASPGSTRP